MTDGIYGVEITGLAEFARVIERASAAVDPDKIVEEGGAILLNRIKTRFLEQVDPDGRPWIPSQAAIAQTGRGRRQAGGTGGGTLFDTGTLFQSIQSAKTAPGEVTIGTDVPYAIYHNEGIGQEERVFLGFGAEDERVIDALIGQRLAGL